MPLNALTDSGNPLPPPDIQRTTFSTDELGRFICNTWEEALAAQSGGMFDVVVVGSGMYGAYAAAKLLELGQRMARPVDAPRILVLEAGPFLLGEHVQNATNRETGLGATVAADLVGARSDGRGPDREAPPLRGRQVAVLGRLVAPAAPRRPCPARR